MQNNELKAKLCKARYSNKKLNDTDREYEVNLTKLVSSKDFTIQNASELEALIKTEKNSSIAYSAFFALIIYYRHQLDYNRLNSLWETYNDKFRSFKSYNHLCVLYFLFNIDRSNEAEQVKHIKIAKRNFKLYKDNPGYIHAFADLFASICEKHENDQSKLKIFKKWYQDSLNAAEEAIGIEPEAAVFYCTKGRILSLFGEYDKADQQFTLAIAQEITNRSDYSLRIGKYQYYKLLNQTRKQFSEAKQKTNALQKSIDLAKKEIKKAKNEMNHSRISNIEIIGIFSGVVSFVIGSLCIVSEYTAFEAGLLILTLMGCLTGALSTFSMLLHIWTSNAESNRHYKIKYTLVIVSSLILSIGSIFAIKALT